MADWAGKTLGKVHINDLVARGGMAEVYKGTHESFGLVAIKVMRGLLERDSEQLSRFQREAEVVAELKHPNIVQMLDYTVVDDTPCLIMEYIQGPSLAAYLKALHEQKQRLPIGVVANLLKSVASALDFAHSKGIVHRDIKPANVLLRSQSDVEVNTTLPIDVEPVLTDFGLVRLLDSTMHTTTGSVSGTPAYMSPEQSRGEKVDKRTDIYSLGIMLYEMLAGAVPFQADTTFGMLMKHINEPPPPIHGVSVDLQALLDRALAKDPSLRYDSAGEMANEFLAVFNGQTISPGTLHIAQLARQAAAEGNKIRSASPPERGSSRWIRIGVEITIALVLAFVLFQFVLPTTTAVTETPVSIDLDIPVGRLRFSDFNNVMDRVTIILNNISQPKEGTHFEAWLINNQSAGLRNIGAIRFNAAGVGQLEFTDPLQQNLLQNFDEVIITVEQNNKTGSTPSDEIIYSSVFPSQSLSRTREILVSFSETPNELALMQGLYYYSGSFINISINGNPLEPGYVGLVNAYQNDDETSLRKRTEEIINLIVGDASDQYLDYNKDGVIDSNDGDGYGSLSSGDRLGYLQETVVHSKNLSDAVDSTPNMRLYSENIQACVQNMELWTNQLLQLALQINETPFSPEMGSIVKEISARGEYLVRGLDVNQNGLVEPVAGECGADLAYEYGWYMADMPLFIGADRVPPSGK